MEGDLSWIIGYEGYTGQSVHSALFRQNFFLESQLKIKKIKKRTEIIVHPKIRLET